VLTVPPSVPVHYDVEKLGSRDQNLPLFKLSNDSDRNRPTAGTRRMSVCPSFRLEKIRFHWTDFHEIRCLRIFRKSVEKINLSFNVASITCILHKGLCSLCCFTVHFHISNSFYQPLYFYCD